MEIGIADNHMNALSGADAGERYHRFVETAVEAERLGFRSMYVTEHHFASDPSYRPFDEPEDVYPSTDSDIVVDPLSLHIFLAARTKTLRLGTCVVCTHWDHPIRIAERAALLDVLSGGRLELGRAVVLVGAPRLDVARGHAHPALAPRLGRRHGGVEGRDGRRRRSARRGESRQPVSERILASSASSSKS